MSDQLQRDYKAQMRAEMDALIRCAREIDPDVELPDDIDNYVLTLSGTVNIGVDVRFRPLAIDRPKSNPET